MANKLISIIFNKFPKVANISYNLVILYKKLELSINSIFIIIKMIKLSIIPVNSTSIIINKSPMPRVAKNIIEDELILPAASSDSNGKNPTGGTPDAIILNAKDNHGQAQILNPFTKFTYGAGVLIVSPFTGEATTGM